MPSEAWVEKEAIPRMVLADKAGAAAQAREGGFLPRLPRFAVTALLPTWPTVEMGARAGLACPPDPVGHRRQDQEEGYLVL